MRISLDDYLLDTERLELRRNATRIAVEPRVLEFLSYLVENRERVVPKQELAETLWQARFVSDAALSRCASDARKALGDTERPYSTIESVYGRGYRFVGTVTEGGSRAQAPATASAPLWMAGAAGLLLAALALYAERWTVQDLEGTETAAITIWSAPAEPSELRSLGHSMADLSQNALAQSPDVFFVAPSQYVPPSLTEEGVIERTRRLGANQALLLRVADADIPRHASFEAHWLTELQNPSPSRLFLGSYALPISDDGADGFDRYLTTRDHILKEIAERAHVGVEPGSSDALTPRSHEAWALYLDAISNLEVACDDRSSRTLLERAVRLDPDFAPAWFALGGTYLIGASFCGGDEANYERARRAGEKAAALAPNWVDPQLFVAYIDLYRGKVEEVYASYRALEKRFPGNFFVQLRLSEALRYAGFLEASRARYEEGLSMWPAAPMVLDDVPYPLLYGGQWEAFLQLLAGRQSPYYRYYRGWALYQLGRIDEAQAILEPAFRQHPADLFARLSQALLHIVRKQNDDAVAVLEQLIDQRSITGSSDGEVTYKIGQLLVLAGNAEPGLDQLELSLEQGFFCALCIEADPVLSRLHETSRLPTLVAIARQRHERFARRFDLQVERSAGTLARVSDGP